MNTFLGLECVVVKDTLCVLLNNFATRLQNQYPKDSLQFKFCKGNVSKAFASGSRVDEVLGPIISIRDFLALLFASNKQEIEAFKGYALDEAATALLRAACIRARSTSKVEENFIYS